MITNTYTLSSQPTTEDVLACPSISYSCKALLRDSLNKDPLDALRDLEVVHAILLARFKRLTAEVSNEI